MASNLAGMVVTTLSQSLEHHRLPSVTPTDFPQEYASDSSTRHKRVSPIDNERHLESWHSSEQGILTNLAGRPRINEVPGPTLAIRIEVPSVHDMRCDTCSALRVTQRGKHGIS